MDTIVLASGLNKIPLYDGYVPGYKALIPLRGRASLQYVLDALRRVDAVGRICIVGPQAILEKELARRRSDDRLEIVEGGETFLGSVTIGLQHFRSAPAVLAVTADLPLLTPGAVRDFLDAAAGSTMQGPTLYISAAPRRCYTGPYAHFTKPFNRYRDVSLCHGNLFLADPALLGIPAVTERVERLYQGRKNALKAAWALGWQVALTYLVGVELLHALTLRQMADFVSRRFGFRIVPVLIDHPEVTMDIDEPDDYAFVRDRLDETQERPPVCT